MLIQEVLSSFIPFRHVLSCKMEYFSESEIAQPLTPHQILTPAASWSGTAAHRRAIRHQHAHAVEAITDAAYRGIAGLKPSRRELTSATFQRFVTRLKPNIFKA